MDKSPNAPSKFEILTAIKDLIAKNKTEKAIEKLKEQVSQEDTNYYDELILVSSVYEDLDTRIRNNLVEFGQINIEKAKINNALIKIANKSILESDEKKSIPTVLAAIQPTKKGSYLMQIGIGIMVLMLAGVGYLIYQNSNDSTNESDNNELTNVNEVFPPTNIAAIPVSTKKDIETPKEKIETTNLALSGKWKMLFYYKDCSSRPQFNNELTISYELDLIQNNLSIEGKGKKYAETFKGKNLIYSKDFEVNLNGNISDNEIKLFLKQKNSFGGDVNGEIILQPQGEKRFVGGFELNDYGCKGRVELKSAL